MNVQFNQTTVRLFVALAVALFAQVSVSAQQSPRRTQPARIFTIRGQVSLPEGSPASRVVVTLATRSGVPRQTYTSDQGRFEFPDIEGGAYFLSASSPSDASLMSSTVEADTSRTATNDLNVDLIFRRDSGPKATNPNKTKTISVVEADQKVPKAARKAFKEGLGFKRDNRQDKALARFGRAIEIYPEYFQALAERGDLYVTQRKLSEAAEDFDRALKINNRSSLALRGAGYCKLERREFAGAVENLEKSVSEDPNNGSTYVLLGIAYMELDQRQSARQALVKAVFLGVLRSHVHLGNLYAREHQYKLAADELKLYLDAEPKAADAANLRAVESQWRARATAP